MKLQKNTDLSVHLSFMIQQFVSEFPTDLMTSLWMSTMALTLSLDVTISVYSFASDPMAHLSFLFRGMRSEYRKSKNIIHRVVDLVRLVGFCLL